MSSCGVRHLRREQVRISTSAEDGKNTEFASLGHR